MAIGNKTDFTIYQDEFFSGMNEVLQQYTDLFNNGSEGAVRLITQGSKGDFEKMSFMRKIAGGSISHRDGTGRTDGTEGQPSNRPELQYPRPVEEDRRRPADVFILLWSADCRRCCC